MTDEEAKLAMDEVVELVENKFGTDAHYVLITYEEGDVRVTSNCSERDLIQLLRGCADHAESNDLQMKPYNTPPAPGNGPSGVANDDPVSDRGDLRDDG